MRCTVLTGLGLAMLLGGSAAADVAATATTDLNVRAGPGTQYPVVGVLEAGSAVALGGCIEGSKWCSVNLSGVTGWAYSDYLVADLAGTQVVLTERPAELSVPTVVYEGPTAAVPAAVGGAIAGAAIGGPVGAVVGGVAGAALGAAVDPPAEVRTYVAGNPVDPVYLDGEVVVGATLPEGVTLAPVPQYKYNYVYVNGVPVLVDPDTRRVVYIFRS
ncbi:MAG TPA: DUF1236 domain-containing protein [Bauldia sp.]|nr:DUF1236 domain-containing protein [Bauldia sp.]